MTDRELLELAAKAAGMVDWLWCDRRFCLCLYNKRMCTWYLDSFGEMIEWNPLTDDGDALRLAVKLKIGIHWMSGRVCAYQDPAIDDQLESSREDALANTRRAIVRAAAEIGKAMP